MTAEKPSATAKAATAKPKPAARKAAKTPARKAATKPKAPIERVPAKEVIAELERLGISRSEAARRSGLSTSSWSEITGHGRGHLTTRERWEAIKAAIAKEPDA